MRWRLVGAGDALAIVLAILSPAMRWQCAGYFLVRTYWRWRFFWRCAGDELAILLAIFGDLLAICWRFAGDALPALAMGLRPSVLYKETLI